MKSLYFVVCALLWACTAAASIETAGVDVNLSGDFSSLGLQGERCHLPDVITIRITSGDVIISVEVSKSPRVTQDAPVYVIGNDGEIRLVISRDSETWALYQDLNSGASVMVTCPPAGHQRPVVEGTVTYQGRQFHLRHSSRRRRDVSSVASESDEYQLTEVAEDPVKGQTIDYVLPPEFHSLHNSPSTSSPGQKQEESAAYDGTPQHRFRRQAAMMGNVYIDTSVVIAFDIYQTFFNESTKTTAAEKEADALEGIRRHYALIMTEVDMHYRMIGSRLPYNISIGLASFVIAQSAAVFPWMETLKERTNQSDRFVVDAEIMLRNLTSWIASSSLPVFDYYVMMTGYDLRSSTAERSTAGLAWTGTVCASATSTHARPGFNSAVVEDGFSPNTVLLIAHEMGHGFGALHDGVSNDCLESDNYIMAATSTINSGTYYGLFSSCSLSYFNTTFAALSSSTSTETCLHEIISPAGVPNVTGLVPGQVYDIQTQCKRAFGNGSSVCPSVTTLGDTMCYETYCSNPGDPTTCHAMALYRGTTCGDKKWCLNGFCVSSPDAPSLDENCPFGNRFVKPYSNRNDTCSQFGSRDPWRCYESNFNSWCCKTCSGIKKNNPGCEFGDRVTGCQIAHCADQSNWEDCCETCSAFRPTTTSTTSNISTTASSTTSITTGEKTVGRSSACSLFSCQKPTSTLLVLLSCFLLEWW